MERKNNDLYLEMIRIIKGKKPKYFIAENVPGILSLGGYANKEASLFAYPPKDKMPGTFSAIKYFGFLPFIILIISK